MAGHGVRGILINNCRADLIQSLHAAGGFIRARSKSFWGSMLESPNLLCVCVIEFLMCHWLSPTAPYWPHLSKYAVQVRPNAVSQCKPLQKLPEDVMTVPSGGEVICETLS